MLFNAEIYRQLSTHPGLSALVADRIYPMSIAPQGVAMPYVTFQRITTGPTYMHGTDTGISREGIQIDCWADDADVVRTVAVQLKNALNTWLEDTVNRAFIVGDQDGYEQDTQLYRVSIDAEVWSTLTAP
jgi:hypothetical protein